MVGGRSSEEGTSDACDLDADALAMSDDLPPALEQRVLDLLDRGDDSDAMAELAALRAAHPDHADGIAELSAEHAAFERVDEIAGGPPARIGDFEISQQIGVGAMGLVYRARDRGLDRDVALKFLHPGRLVHERARRRFAREARALARVRHDGLCRIYGIGQHRDEPFLVMELLHGIPLDRHLAAVRSGQAPRARAIQAAQLMERIARAMHAAHEAGVLHRDLKPANIMLASDERPVIYDFGLAKTVHPRANASRLTRSNDLVGTLHYMAPELIDGASADVRTDVYALGVTLYEVLTLRLPFDAPTESGLIDAIRSDEPSAMSRADVPSSLQNVVGCALERDPARRYATCAALADDLRRFCEQLPVTARPRSLWQRGVRWQRRHPIASAVFLVLTLAFVTTASIGYGWHQALLRESDAHARTRDAQLEERRAHALRFLEAARAARQRGDSSAVLAACAAAREAGHEDEVAVDLLAIDAHEALSDLPAAEALLLPLVGRSDAELGAHAARVRLLQAFAALGGTQQEVTALCERALALDTAAAPRVADAPASNSAGGPSGSARPPAALGLTPAERRLAEALAAPDLAGLRAGLRATLAIDRGAVRAIALLGVVELLCGDTSAALDLADRHELLRPDAWLPTALRYCVLILTGQGEAAKRVIDAARSKVPPDLCAALELAGRAFDTVHRTTARIIDDYVRSFVGRVPRAPTEDHDVLEHISGALALLQTPRVHGETLHGVRLPPQVRAAIRPGLRYLPGLVAGRADWLEDVSVDEAELVTLPYFVRVVSAWLIAKEPVGEHGTPEHILRLERILALCRAPREGIAVTHAVPGLRRLVAQLTLRILANLLAVQPDRSDDLRRLAFDSIRELSGEPTTTSSEFFVAVDLAAATFDAPPAVLDRLFADWRARFPEQSTPWRLEAAVRLRRNEPAAARRCLDEALRLQPDDTKAREMRASLK